MITIITMIIIITMVITMIIIIITMIIPEIKHNSGGRTALNVSLRVDHAPTLNVSRTVFQAPGYPTSLDCQVAAVPVPAVAWLRHGKRVTSDGKFAISISNYRDGWITVSLLIPSVSLSQYGN